MKIRHVVWIAVITASVGTGVWWLARADDEPGGSALRMAELRRGDVETVVSCTGTLSALGTVTVGAQVSADLKKIHVDFNDRVHKGQVLAEFDTAMLVAERERAEAEQQRLAAVLAKAEAEYNRNRPLFDKGFLSDTEFQVYKLDAESARAQLKAADAALEIARTNLRYAVIRSPVDGTVIERSVEEGQTLVSRMATPTLFVIAEDLAHMQIQADVDESDIGQIRQGQKVRFSVQAYLDETFQGEVRQIRLQPKTVQNVVSYTVIADADNPDGRLLPGMTATVDFLIDAQRNVLLVPNRALQVKVPVELLRVPPVDPAAGLRPRGPPPGPPPGESEAAAQAGPKRRVRVYVAAADGAIRPVEFDPGISDGKVTAVREGPGLEVGMQVVIGTNLEEGKSEVAKTKIRGRGPGGPPPF